MVCCIIAGQRIYQKSFLIWLCHYLFFLNIIFNIFISYFLYFIYPTYLIFFIFLLTLTLFTIKRGSDYQFVVKLDKLFANNLEKKIFPKNLFESDSRLYVGIVLIFHKTCKKAQKPQPPTSCKKSEIYTNG